VVVLGWARGEIRERFLLMAALEVLCLRESEGKITPEVRARLRALQKEMVTARAHKDVARAAVADGRFHHLLWETAGLPQVLRILENLWDRGEYYRLLMHARRGGFAGESLNEHEMILKALDSGTARSRGQGGRVSPAGGHGAARTDELIRITPFLPLSPPGEGTCTEDAI
jgi:DNA-binding GntR family transcriptional regulator